ncbi:MAG TPA: Vps62-related protein, partial [Solirubrobacterales bacterium]|nr:Vps62-related protein [Solirubrobacterales bacterium]
APEIAHNTFTGNGSGSNSYALYYATTSSSQTGEIKIHDNIFEGNQANAIGVFTANAKEIKGTTLGGNAINSNAGFALAYSGADIPGDVSNNSADGNGADIIEVAGTVAHSSTWKLGGAPLRFSGTVVVAAGATLTLKPGIYIQTPRMTVNGSLRVEGTADRPVALTGIAQENSGEWGSITLEPGSGSSLLDYAEVAFGGKEIPMLNVRGVSPTITNSTFRRSMGDGIRVSLSGHPIIEGNRFRDSQFGLRYEGIGKLSAPDNDWGCVNGPKPTGCGDEVTSNVEWQPTAVLQELPRLCPGATMLATSTTCLLQKYEPQLRYDSEENYFADSAAEITDNWGDEEALRGSTETGRYSNFLVDETSEWPFSTVLAVASPFVKGGSFPLTLSSLGGTYPNGQTATEADLLVEGEEYVRDAHRLEAAGYLNAAYAHAVTDATGKRWLEYWYWYYYNPKDYAGIGKHEGDWETVIVGLDANSRPEEVIFSQHEGSSNCYIGDVEQVEEGGPVVYVGLDSHAGYQKPGAFWATGEDDYADGDGAWVKPGLIIIGNSPPSWILWPGHWGHTHPEGGVPGQATSPPGPYFHDAWSAPDAYASEAYECTETSEEGQGPLEIFASSGAASPGIRSVKVVGRRPEVSYVVPKADGEGFWPRLRISVNELGDGGIPPTSSTISNVKAKGTLTVPLNVRPGHAAEVTGSIVYKNGRRVHLAPKVVEGS